MPQISDSGHEEAQHNRIGQQKCYVTHLSLNPELKCMYIYILSPNISRHDILYNISEKNINSL